MLCWAVSTRPKPKLPAPFILRYKGNFYFNQLKCFMANYLYIIPRFGCYRVQREGKESEKANGNGKT